MILQHTLFVLSSWPLPLSSRQTSTSRIYLLESGNASYSKSGRVWLPDDLEDGDIVFSALRNMALITLPRGLEMRLLSETFYYVAIAWIL